MAVKNVKSIRATVRIPPGGSPTPKKPVQQSVAPKLPVFGGLGADTSKQSIVPQRTPITSNSSSITGYGGQPTNLMGASQTSQAETFGEQAPMNPVTGAAFTED